MVDRPQRAQMVVDPIGFQVAVQDLALCATVVRLDLNIVKDSLMHIWNMAFAVLWAARPGIFTFSSVCIDTSNAV